MIIEDFIVISLMFKKEIIALTMSISAIAEFKDHHQSLVTSHKLGNIFLF